jgi:hypothetical protein
MLSEHCPFVNRSEAACEKHLRLGDMAWAMDHCFSAYEACPTYTSMAEDPANLTDRPTSQLLQVTVYGRPVGVPQPAVGPAIALSGHARSRRPKTVVYVPGEAGIGRRIGRALLNLTVGQLPASWRRAG